MKTIFLTGATGNMGRAGLHELLGRRDRFNIRILARPSKKNIKELKPLSNMEGLTVLWGDLLDYDDVLKGVAGADFVLHVGGMVSPEADKYPQKTMQVNLTSAENIIKAVKAQDNADSIGVVYIGSVAQTGSKMPPHHWGRCGDPIAPATLDWYAVSKCLAEWMFAESGLRKWVSIRQSGMLYSNLLKKANDPIAFHVPFKGVLEWTTLEDSGRLLANVCEDWVPDSFWRNFYNLSSGPSYRLTNYEFEQLLLETISCPPVEKVFDCRWFATRNFHGQWYLDADRLEDILHFRDNMDCKDYFLKMKKELPWYFSLAPLVPAFIIKAFMRHVASSNPLGTLNWLKTNNQKRIKAHFGSLEEWKAIPSWKNFDTKRPATAPIILDHGYNESKSIDELTEQELQKVASLRGGEIISFGSEKILWQCGRGHRFEATSNTILKGGHWCPECLKSSS